MTAKATNPSFMNGVPELLILHVLADGEMYGYELIRAITARTGERITFGEGVILPNTPFVRAGGVPEEPEEEVAGRSRVYYRLTARGRRRLGEVTTDWQRVTDAVRALIERGGDAEPAV